MFVLASNNSGKKNESLKSNKLVNFCDIILIVHNFKRKKTQLIIFKRLKMWDSCLELKCIRKNKGMLYRSLMFYTVSVVIIESEMRSDKKNNRLCYNNTTIWQTEDEIKT